mmetsp:Transcript_43711/g.72199  ORF Transcript_43711/g.72199 Transcript_43711/m.72199 type:complete len:564 (-) Transcript_43711:263-1954(-)
MMETLPSVGSLKFCQLADTTTKDKCLARLTQVLCPPDIDTSTPLIKQSSAFDEEENKKAVSSDHTETESPSTRIANYLRSCRENTIKNDSSLQVLLRSNHEHADKIKIDDRSHKDATFWICDMIKAPCLLMFISWSTTFVIDAALDVYLIPLTQHTNFAKICVDSADDNQCTVVQGSFMDKNASKKEFLMEDILCYRSERMLTVTLLERMTAINKIVANFRKISGGAYEHGNYPFEFRGKPWFANNGPKACVTFFEHYRTSTSTQQLMYRDGRHAENVSLGYMIWSMHHVPLSSMATMLHWTYPPRTFVQIQVPIHARHQNNHNNHYNRHHQHNGMQIGMTNKMGVLQDFNAMSNQSIQLFLRNEYDGNRTIAAVKAQFDEQSMRSLIATSQTNIHNQFILCRIMYSKQQSCYSVLEKLSESKISNLVEKNAHKYNEMLLKAGSWSSVHSASEKEKIALLTSSVTEFVRQSTHVIQMCAKEAVVAAFQDLSKHVIKARLQKPKTMTQSHQHQNHQQQQSHHRNQNHHSHQHRDQHREQHHHRQTNVYKPAPIPDPPNYSNYNA